MTLFFIAHVCSIHWWTLDWTEWHKDRRAVWLEWPIHCHLHQLGFWKTSCLHWCRRLCTNHRRGNTEYFLHKGWLLKGPTTVQWTNEWSHFPLLFYVSYLLLSVCRMGTGQIVGVGRNMALSVWSRVRLNALDMKLMWTLAAKLWVKFAYNLLKHSSLSSLNSFSDEQAA